MRYSLVVPSLVLLVACGHDEAVPPTTPAPAVTAESMPAAPAASSATPAPPAAPSASASPPVATSSKALPPVGAHCKADADCATVQLNLEGDLQCCTGCGTSTAGTKAWVASVKDACAQPPHKSCPALACVGGLLKAECKAGTCALKK